MADGLGLSLQFMKPFYGNPLRLDWFVSNVFQQERKLTQTSAKASIPILCIPFKEALNTDFINIHKYIKEINPFIT
jgi:hypothetical protein